MSFTYDFTRLQNKEHLIHFLGINETLFDDVLTFDPNRMDFNPPSNKQTILIGRKPFSRHMIPKKNGRGHRIVWEPTVLKNNYKALARTLNNFLVHKLVNFPHPRAFGYIRGRNIRENALGHCGHTHLISIDLEDFFPSIKVLRVAEFLKTTGIEPSVADLLSRFVTIEGALALGLPTSPTIANAICLAMDRDLQLLAQNCAATFSRYADDISFSSDDELPTLEDIATGVQEHGFRIAVSKTRRSTLGQAHYVTGLSVSDPVRPHVPKEKKRHLRQELYFARKYGLHGHLSHIGIHYPYTQRAINRLDGLVKFTAYHEPELSSYLKTQWGEILQASGESPSFEPKSQDGAAFFIYVDEAEYIRPDGDRLLALGMAASQHQEQINQSTYDLLSLTLSDLWAAGSRDAILKKGMHFSDATEDMRLAYIERMRFLPFEGYVAMGRLPNAADYEATYLRLLKSMIKRRLMAAESQLACLVFEQNSKVKQELIRSTVMNAYGSLEKSNNRRPLDCAVDFVKKPNLGMSVPDFLLGALHKYLATSPAQEGKPLMRNELLFERIRDKYRLILDIDNRIEYSRRNPIVPW